MAEPSDNIDRRFVLAAGGSAVMAAPLHAAVASVTTVTDASPDAAVVPGAASQWASTNPALTGAFAPVFDERDDANLVVEGEIPAGLRGIFMRNGPNPQFEPDTHYAYPFDGTGMVHAVYLQDGQARYRNRWVRTADFQREQAAGRRIYNSTFSAPPHANLANTNITFHAGRYLALYEGGKPYEVDRELATTGLFDYGGTLPTVMSAHPKLDPASGELLSIAYNAQTGAMIYLRASRTGQLDTVVPFQAPWPTMVHDVAITERHVLAFIGPAVWGQGRAGPPIAWQPERGMTVAVIPREAKSAGDIQWITGAPFFQFHIMNAFADGDRIEVTVLGTTPFR